MKWYPEHKCFADEDAFDENGILQPGKRIRQPTMMRDARSVFRDDNPVPQWAMDEAARMLGRDAVTTVTDADWQRRQDAYNTAELDLANRWRGGVGSLRAGDVVSVGNQQRAVASHDDGKLALWDAAHLDSETIKQSAYDAYDHDIQNRWRTRDAESGDECTINGEVGRWRKDKDGNLVCKPAKSSQPSENEWAMAGPLSDSKRQSVKDASYAEYERNICEAWRR